MEGTATGRRSERFGLFRRLIRPPRVEPDFGFGPRKAITFQARRAQPLGPLRTSQAPHEPRVVDLSAPAPDPIERRLERVEAGSRLILSALKRLSGELFAAVDTVQAQVATLAARGDAERSVGEAVDRLAASADRLSSSLETFPHILAAATADMAEGMVATRASVERALSAMPESLRWPERPPPSSPRSGVRPGPGFRRDGTGGSAAVRPGAG